MTIPTEVFDEDPIHCKYCDKELPSKAYKAWHEKEFHQVISIDSNVNANVRYVTTSKYFVSENEN